MLSRRSLGLQKMELSKTVEEDRDFVTFTTGSTTVTHTGIRDLSPLSFKTLISMPKLRLDYSSSGIRLECGEPPTAVPQDRGRENVYPSSLLRRVANRIMRNRIRTKKMRSNANYDKFD
ncbi:unnamed protein product [Calicophoron daubneyi]|uniref:Uncharacterized protein n=1 Tax=Calicophoron daubneyi TaxID=300641 RepID=A0AAV2T4C1_CALDB